jgi:predicted nucleic acid-binding protein
MPPVLIDTNVLIYTYDHQDPRRQEQAIRLLQALQASSAGRLSVQCLAEFASASTHKIAPPLTRAEAVEQVERWARAFLVYNLTPQIVLTAVRGARDHRLSYYDAQLWATALLNQVLVIFSEDFASGSSLEGVRLVNPFAPEFALNDWA